MYIGKNGKKYPCHGGYGNVKPGDRFGKVTVIKKGPRIHYKNGDSRATWVCKCDCGNEVTFPALRFKDGNAAYFRCDKCMKDREVMFSKATGIIQRCNCVDSSEWKNYGARGIKCELGVTSSEVADMLQSIPGFKKGYSIDRIDNNGNYTIWHPIHMYNVYDYIDPYSGEVFKARGNLRWVPHSINNLNKRNNVTIDYLMTTSRVPAVFKDICKRCGWDPNHFDSKRDTNYPHEARYFYYVKEEFKERYNL